MIKPLITLTLSPHDVDALRQILHQFDGFILTYKDGRSHKNWGEVLEKKLIKALKKAENEEKKSN